MSFKKKFSGKTIVSWMIAAALVAGAAMSSPPANAYGYWRGGRGWRGGHWYHGPHGGQLGWWWISAGNWYFYTRPAYPYPVYVQPPVVVQPQAYPPPPMIAPAPVPAAPPQVAMPLPTVPPGYTGGAYYYCDNARAYYPYVSNCPGGWTAVPTHPQN